MTTPAPAGPGFGFAARAVSENISGVNGQTLKVSRNHLPGRSFLQGGACGAADVSLES